jgi:hypothetical protein
MIPIEIRNSVRLLRAQGQSLREISRLLKLSRNAVRRILREGERASPPSLPCNAATLARLADAFRRAGGIGVRVQELLVSEIGLNVPYSTLTRWIWEAELRDLPKRSGEYHQGPGEEMQHDTSFAPACSSNTTRASRFEAKYFMLEATRFNDASCPLCIIDNTSVLVVAGARPDAVIAPEMVAFAGTLGFVFCAHHLGHADRKGRIERPFSYIERNLLAGRSFSDFDDLNRQALAWCREVAR